MWDDGWKPVNDPSDVPTVADIELPFSVVARVVAIADLDGDGDMEIGVDSAYHEGAGTEIWDYVDDDLGFVSASHRLRRLRGSFLGLRLAHRDAP